MIHKVIGIDPFGTPRVRASGDTPDEAYHNCCEKIRLCVVPHGRDLLGTWKVKEDAREV